MGKEIERKFLVSSDVKPFAESDTRIIQGYLSSSLERSVRVRIKGKKAFLTIKGIGNQSGISRFEWEKEISLKDAKELFKICEPGVIDKTRYIIPVGSHVFEVDEFHGDNEGLILAEIELSSEKEEFNKPFWLGKEVTGDSRYYNLMLIKKPYNTWK